MARLSKAELFDLLITSLEDSGWKYLIEKSSHPFVIRLLHDETPLRVRIYIWNVTHGGGSARAADEYRIQITSGVTSFDTSGVDRTLVLGWWEDGGVFAGWDVSKHTGALGSSPSLQIVEGVLRKALVNRAATQRKGNDEIAIAFVPGVLGEYILDQPQLHGFAATDRDLGALEKVLENPATPAMAIGEATSEPRKIVLAQVARKLRLSGFVERVLRAYAYRCAMCSVQLRLIDAAHIVPVAFANDDTTRNGIALCSLHHRAYDASLLSMDSGYRVVLNPDRIARLKRDDRVGGLQAFRKHLRALLDLPPAVGDRPDPRLIDQANTVRGWKRMERVA